MGGTEARPTSAESKSVGLGRGKMQQKKDNSFVYALGSIASNINPNDFLDDDCQEDLPKQLNVPVKSQIGKNARKNNQSNFSFGASQPISADANKKGNSTSNAAKKRRRDLVNQL